MSKVRLRFSGAISFLAQLVGYLIGILFTVMISRRLTEDEFGAWAYIGVLIAYAIIPTDFFSTWIYRDSARGKKILGSVLFLHSLILLSATAIYIILSGIASSSVGLDRGIVLLGLLTLIPQYLVTILTDVVKGFAPQDVGFGKIIFEILKLTIGLFLIVQLRLGLLGVFSTLSIAYTIQAMYLLLRARELFTKTIDFSTIRRWLRGSVFKVFSIASQYFSAIDVVLISTIMASTLITGYWQAALLVGLLVKSTESLMSGLSQRLLSGGGQQDIDKSFQFVMTFSVPVLVGAMIMGGDILYAFRPSYSSVWPVASFLALSNFIIILTNFYVIILFASDKFDLKSEVSFRDFANSRVFLLWKVDLLFSIIYGGILAIVLISLSTVGMSMLITLLSLSLVHLIINVAKFIVYRQLSKKFLKNTLNVKSLIYYFLSATIMALIVMFAKSFINPRELTLLKTLPPLLTLIGLGTICYFIVLWIICKEFRNLVKDVKIFLENLY